MTTTSNVIRTVQAIGITSSAVLSGGILSFSVVLIPTLALPAHPTKRESDSSDQPGTPTSHLARQWRHSFNTGKHIAPPIALLSSTAYAYLAYLFRRATPVQEPELRTSNLYILAAALALSLVPYTLVVMMPTNQRLLVRAAQADDEAATPVEKERDMATTGVPAKAEEDAEVCGLLEKWSRMNVVRGCLPLAATVVGLFATLF